MELFVFVDEDVDLDLGNDDLPILEGVSLRRPREGESFRGRFREEEFPELLTTWVLTIGGGISLNLVAAWLYDKLKKHSPKTIRINRQEVIMDRGQIERIIREEIEIRK